MHEIKEIYVIVLKNQDKNTDLHVKFSLHWAILETINYTFTHQLSESRLKSKVYGLLIVKHAAQVTEVMTDSLKVTVPVMVTCCHIVLVSRHARVKHIKFRVWDSDLLTSGPCSQWYTGEAGHWNEGKTERRLKHVQMSSCLVYRHECLFKIKQYVDV